MYANSFKGEFLLHIIFLANIIIAFLQKTKKPIIIIGLYYIDVWYYLEKSTKNYIIAAKFNHPIQRIIDQSNNWILLDYGIQICEQNYQAQSWEKPRRMVVVRQKLKERPNAAGKMLCLFPEDEIH